MGALLLEEAGALAVAGSRPPASPPRHSLLASRRLPRRTLTGFGNGRRQYRRCRRAGQDRPQAARLSGDRAVQPHRHRHRQRRRRRDLRDDRRGVGPVRRPGGDLLVHPRRDRRRGHRALLRRARRDGPGRGLDLLLRLRRLRLVPRLVHRLGPAARVPVRGVDRGGRLVGLLRQLPRQHRRRRCRTTSSTRRSATTPASSTCRRWRSSFATCGAALPRHPRVDPREQRDGGAEARRAAALRRRRRLLRNRARTGSRSCRTNQGGFGDFGVTGILRAAGVVFFAYVGFDAVSTAAAEARRPAANDPDRPARHRADLDRPLRRDRDRDDRDGPLQVAQRRRSAGARGARGGRVARLARVDDLGGGRDRPRRDRARHLLRADPDLHADVLRRDASRPARAGQQAVRDPDRRDRRLRDRRGRRRRAAADRRPRRPRLDRDAALVHDRLRRGPRPPPGPPRPRAAVPRQAASGSSRRSGSSSRSR